MANVSEKTRVLYQLLKISWFFIVMWSVISIVILTPFTYNSYRFLRWSNFFNKDVEHQECLKQISSQVQIMKWKYSRLIVEIKKNPGLINGSTLQLYPFPDLDLVDQSPTEEYEKTRRRIYFNINELWYYVSHKLRIAVNEKLEAEQVQTILKEVADRKRWLLSQQEKLPALDGHETWRRREAASASDLVQRRLHHLQHPRDCRAARKLVCGHDTCGFGCDIHHLAYCLVTAYSLGRTLILVDSAWYYADEFKQWHDIFRPLSENCTSTYTDTIKKISTKDNNANVIHLPYYRYLRKLKVTEFQPHFVPKDLGQRIIRFNGDPYSWWIGQMLKYILKLKNEEAIDSTIADMSIKSPIVGIHVRRSDKIGVEAQYHDLDEYMSHVDDYYSQLELTRDVYQRRVYIATDDFRVMDEAINKYPQYVFYGDPFIAVSADPSIRYSSQSIHGLLVNLRTLYSCDYVVCTFSSNIGRMVYELMQTNVDATNRITSLDHSYYHTDNELGLRIAVMKHADPRIALEIGDIIEYRRLKPVPNGTVWRTRKVGLVPWHKTNEQLALFPHKTYEQVPLD